ncbi:MAG: glycosyltransferase family A protein [Pseudomonadota bacterium]
MSLGLVIPVRDDSAALNRLLAGARRLGIFDQTVVVDDGSAAPVVCTASQTIRQDHATGPGLARNRGLAEIQTDHVLFFDSDDLILPEIVPLWHSLRGRDFDFCLFRHVDTRRIGDGHWWQTPHDDALWRLAGMGGQHLAPVSAQAAPWLAQTASYPWNKIYRTGFLRGAGISFPDILLHEDVAPHWQSFAAATTILASDRVCARHRVTPGGNRMTNMRGPERLDAIGSLTQLGTSLRPPLRRAFQSFVSELFDWIHYHVDPRWHDDLRRAVSRFWRDTLQPDEEAALIRKDPVMAMRIALQMTGGPVPC